MSECWWCGREFEGSGWFCCLKCEHEYNDSKDSDSSYSSSSSSGGLEIVGGFITWLIFAFILVFFTGILPDLYHCRMVLPSWLQWLQGCSV